MTVTWILPRVVQEEEGEGNLLSDRSLARLLSARNARSSTRDSSRSGSSSGSDCALGGRADSPRTRATQDAADKIWHHLKLEGRGMRQCTVPETFQKAREVLALPGSNWTSYVHWPTSKQNFVLPLVHGMYILTDESHCGMSSDRMHDDLLDEASFLCQTLSIAMGELQASSSESDEDPVEALRDQIDSAIGCADLAQVLGVQVCV
jgi:hypothetical protein